MPLWFHLGFLSNGLLLRLWTTRVGRPGFSFVAILTLALGIGANTATFSVINAILVRPLPVERPSELVTVNETFLTPRSRR